MKNILRILILLFATVSCQRDPMPRNALSEEEFVDVLVDVHIAQALYIDRVRLKIDSLRSDELYLSVLEKHNVSEEDMNATTLYYTRHPKKYDKIFSLVLSEISLLQEDENNEPNILIEGKN